MNISVVANEKAKHRLRRVNNENMTKEREILQRLVDLKDHKDKYGKDEHYQREQPVLWEIARQTLASDRDLADASVSKSRKKRNECAYCDGSGAAPFHHSDKCPICKGTGFGEDD